jgi:hypothetical protein
MTSETATLLTPTSSEFRHGDTGTWATTAALRF